MHLRKNSLIAAIHPCLRTLLLAGGLTFGAEEALGQETPKVQIGVLYSSIPEIFGPTCHGVAGTVSYNVNRWFSAVGDLTGCKGTGQPTSLLGPSSAPPVTHTFFAYMAGPRVSYRRRLTPYAHVLFGGAHANNDNTFSVIRGDAFATAVGIGVDLKLTHRFSIRVIQPEYLRTKFGNGVVREDLRIGSGAVFTVK